MNPGKTDFTLIGTKSALQKTANFQIETQGSIIQPSTTMKVLGVILDQHLTWAQSYQNGDVATSPPPCPHGPIS